MARDSNAQSSVILPRELVDEIVGDMDHAALTACALLSRHWHISAQRMLFKNITVLVPKMPWAIHNSEHTLDAFATFLALSNAGVYIKYLRIHGAGDITDQQVTAVDLDRVLSHLSHLELLDMTALHFTGCPAQSLVECWRRPKNLRSLTLKDIHLVPPSSFLTRSKIIPARRLTQCAFVQLLNMFGDVQRLSLGDVQFWEDLFGTVYTHTRYRRYWNKPTHALRASSKLSPSFNMEELVSYISMDTSHADIFQILALSQSLESLRVLSIYGESGMICREQLQMIGQNLTHLHITLEYFEDQVKEEVRVQNFVQRLAS